MNEPQHHDRPKPGWQLIGPGMYLDTENSMHLFADELLKSMGWPDTKENREMLYRVGPKVVREIFGKDIPAWITSRDEKPERL